jgi:hypothetical protein
MQDRNKHAPGPLCVLRAFCCLGMGTNQGPGTLPTHSLSPWEGCRPSSCMDRRGLSTKLQVSKLSMVGSRGMGGMGGMGRTARGLRCPSRRRRGCAGGLARCYMPCSCFGRHAPSHGQSALCLLWPTALRPAATSPCGHGHKPMPAGPGHTHMQPESMQRTMRSRVGWTCCPFELEAPRVGCWPPM